MRDTDIAHIWQDAATFDRTLKARPDQLARLRRKQVHAASYTRQALFNAMARGEPAVLAGVQVSVAGSDRLGLEAALVKHVGSGFDAHQRANAQIGPSQRRTRLGVHELMRKWSSRRSLVSVTDLHIRGTPLERKIDTAQLSAFNLLPQGSEGMQRQEMMTLVIGARGNVTDSHSDDPDGSNHCFMGRKLWLAWETFEGIQAGLQDCERGLVRGRARFNLDRFCELKSARWWTVEPGETLFLPGRLTHKVVTLAAYLGIGSFYVAPVSCLDSLSRWYLHQPLWSLDDPRGENAGLVDEIAGAMQRQLQKLARQSLARKQQWGLDFVRPATERWMRNWSLQQRDALMARAPFVRVMEALQQAGSVAGV